MSVNYSIPAYRISLIRDGACPSSERPKILESKTAAQILQQYLDGADREHFVVLLLDRKNVVIGIHTVSVGSLSASIVHPRETFKAAIMGTAAAIICGHNHPSGDPAPSQEDRLLTQRLVDGGKLLGIPVLDHIIIGEGTHFSFADNGLIQGDSPNA